MFNNFGQIINRVCRCDPGDDSHDQMTGRQWISNHEVLVSRMCTGNEDAQLRLKTFNNFGWFIWHKCNCNSELLTIHELNNYGTIVNCKSTCRQKVPVQISPQSLHYAGSPGHQATLATTPNSLTHQQLNGSHEVVSPRPPRNSSIAISNLQPQAQEISLPRPVEISPIGQPNTMTTRRLCGSCRILENLPKLSDNHSFQNQQPQINSVMNKENHEQPSSNPIFLKRKAESFASQENPATRQKVESIMKSPENRSTMESPKPTKFQNFKTNSSNVQIRIIPQSTTQQQMKSRNIATNSHFLKILPKPSMASSVSQNNSQYLGSWIKVKNPHLPEATTVAKSGKTKLSFLQEDSYQKDMHKRHHHYYRRRLLKRWILRKFHQNILRLLAQTNNN
ncbi:uncharacterized protein LOC119560267 [Drosophila subpulchrella]|uniref:uncharacterized protein LOC119560267 n=1 Tax=Drosophila subpulchrella TaxID=1486046 RepID=UPI0018A1740B|nr:uncharacterized protein LOC119560267 [Drosophila subpulchrella]